MKENNTKFTLMFIDGGSMTFDAVGTLVGCTDNEGNVEDPSNYSNGVAQDINGIWYDDEKCTIPWDEVVDYKFTDFHLVSGMYIDNGQVVDEGEIVKMVIDDLVVWSVEEEGIITDVTKAFVEEYESIGVVGEQMTAFANVALRLCEQIEDSYDLGVAMERLYKALKEAE